MTDGNEYVTVAIAADLAGIPERTLRYWIKSGKVSAIAGKGCRLVRLGDVREIAALTGRDHPHNEPAGNAAGNPASHVPGNLADLATDPAGRVSATADLAGIAGDAAGNRAETALRHLMQQVVAPLAAANERQAAELERVQAVARQQAEELGQERALREQAQAQLAARDDQAEALVAELRRRAEVAEQDAQELRWARRGLERDQEGRWWLRLLRLLGERP